MAACGSLAQHIFETSTLSDQNPTTLLETLSSSWTPIMALKQTEQHSTFTQIFGRHPRDSSSSKNTESFPGFHRRSSSEFSSANSESLQLCTEGLGYESLDDVEDLEGGGGGVECWEGEEEDEKGTRLKKVAIMRTKSANMEEFPPPISCMAKPWAGFKSYRYGGRFILKEITGPTHEFLHASRENGRLKLHILVPNEHQTTEKSIEKTNPNP